MAERLLYKNSCNISALIHLLTIHEENTGRFIRHQNNNDNSLVNLLNNVFINNNFDISGVDISGNINRGNINRGNISEVNIIGVDISGLDLSGTYTIPITNRNRLVFNDNSLNSIYLDEIRYGDLSYCNYTRCPISWETFTDDCQIVKIKSCGHYFKREEIIPWLRENIYCPYCRSNIIQEINDREIYS